MSDLIQDARLGLRLLARHPGVAAVAVVSLALGIGINTTVFSVVNAVLLRPLPVRDPGSLVDIYTSGSGGDSFSTSSYPDLLDLREQNTVFSDLAGHSLVFAHLTHEGRSRLVMGEVVTENYFGVLGVRPALGRDFTPEENRVPGRDAVAVLGHGFWRKELGGALDVVGRTIRLNGKPYAVIGVAPESFRGVFPAFTPDLWLPAMMVNEVEPLGLQESVPSPEGTHRLERRGQRWIFMKGRLREGVEIEQARAQLDTIMSRLQRQYPSTNGDRRLSLLPTSDVRLHPSIDRALAPAAWLVLAVVGLVQLIVCANVASMLLARASERAREMAVRLALGAGRGRLVRQLVTESLLLAGAGGIAGFVLAKLAIGIVAAYQPPLPFTISFDLSVDARVLLFTMMVSLATGVVFGLAPALHASRPDLVPALKASSAREAAGRRRFGLRSILAAAQMSLAMVLMVGAALLSRSIWAARSLDLGFRPERLALVSVEMGMHGYSEAAGKAFFRDALERVRAAPGVRSAAWAWNAPFSANNMSHEFLIEGRSYPPDSPGESIAVAYLSPGYFATLETPLLEGRDFTEADRETTPGAAIVSEALARKYWPGESAIGKRIRRARRDESLEVIGVSGDYKVRTLGERPRPVVHLALSQRYSPAATLVARGDGSESPLVETIRGKMLELDPNLALFEAKTMREQMALPLFPVRAAAALISGAGLFALLLAAIGIYGVIAHSVGQRRREVGLRMALGAERGNVVKMVLGEGMAIAAAGMVVGLAAAALAGRILGAVLYQVSALDPTAFASASLVMLGVALLANYLPARRAAGANPVVALRHD